MVLPNSCKAPRTPHYSGARLKQLSRFSRTRLSRALAALPRVVPLTVRFLCCPRDLPLPPVGSHDPQRATPAGLTLVRFRLFPVRSPLLRESLLFSLPPGTEMVHFPGLASPDLWIQSRDRTGSPYGVPPFGHRRITGCVLLPVAYRSLPRPSSPTRA
jgi:hypothetical protein